MSKKERSANKNYAATNYLDLIPNTILGHQIEENGQVTLLYPRFSNKIWRSLISQKAKQSHIYLHLDDFGSKTWLLIDGKRNVAAICDELVLTFGDKIQPVAERTTTFLTQLLRQKYIKLSDPSLPQ